MATVYGTNERDWLGVFRDGFHRDGVTDGDDTIFGFGGDDWIEGHDGNDLLEGGEGADLLIGGDDIDTAVYGDSPVGVYVNLQTHEGHFGTAEGDRLISIENITGSWFNDDLVGDSNDNVLSGLGGDDDLQGNGGADILDGGWGEDTANYTTSPAGVSICLLWHSASGGDAEGDQLISIEDLYGTNFDDSLFGDDGANFLHGGGNGNDVLLGFGGNDYLMGSSGNDSLNGGAGLDLIDGGIGADTLIGGADADTFLFETQYDSAGADPSGIDYANTDVILDFNNAEGDKIDVHYVDANAPLPGNQDFDFIGEYFGAGGFTASGQAAYFNDGNNTYILFNTDTPTGSFLDFDFAIRLPGMQTPEASWFHL